MHPPSQQKETAAQSWGDHWHLLLLLLPLPPPHLVVRPAHLLTVH